MRLSLSYDSSDPDMGSDLEFVDNRRYVIRALVPTGYEEYFQE